MIKAIAQFEEKCREAMALGAIVAMIVYLVAENDHLVARKRRRMEAVEFSR